MAGLLRINCTNVQTAGVSFGCHVTVTGGLPGDTVRIRLWQTAGVSPAFHSTSQEHLDGAGNGMAAFEVTLPGPCTAQLTADDVVSPVPLLARLRLHPVGAMKLALALALGLTGCLDEQPVTVDDVIGKFTIETPAAGRVADGATPLDFKVCRTADTGFSKTEKVALRASAGAWTISEADVKVTMLDMSKMCEHASLRPPVDAGLITVTATLASFTKKLDVTVLAAPVSKVNLSRAGGLAETGTSTLTLTADLVLMGAGKPTIGTPVTYTVHVDEPDGGSAYVTSPATRIAMGTTTQTSLVVAQGVTQVTVTATASPEGQPPVPSDPMVITR